MLPLLMLQNIYYSVLFFTSRNSDYSAPCLTLRNSIFYSVLFLHIKRTREYLHFNHFKVNLISKNIFTKVDLYHTKRSLCIGPLDLNLTLIFIHLSDINKVHNPKAWNTNLKQDIYIDKYQNP